MIDNIFNKIYKHKRYLPINESVNYHLKKEEEVEKIFTNFNKEIEQYIDSKRNIKMAINGTRFIFYKTLGTFNQVLESNTDLDSFLENYASQLYNQNNVNINSDNEISYHKIANYQGNIVNMCLFTRLVIDTVLLKSWKDAPVYYKLGVSTIQNSYIDKIYNNHYVRDYTLNQIQKMLNNAETKYIDFLNFKEQLNLENSENKEFSPQDVSNSDEAKNQPSITIASDKSKNINIRLYTKQLIADSRPRNFKNNTNMLLNSCDKLLTALESPNSNVKRSILKFSKDSDDIHNIALDEALTPEGEKRGRGRPRKNTIDGTDESTAYKIMKANSGEENKKILNTIHSVLTIYKEAIKNSYDDDFTSNYKSSAGNNAHLQVYLPEILSPYALCYNACKWTKLGKDSGYKTLQNVVGSSGNNFLNVPCYIGYYDLSTSPLADSYAWINGKFIDISTKAGLDGKGAAASIESLRKYIYETGLDGKLTNTLSPKGESVKFFYPLEFEIFEHLSTNKKATKETVRQILIKYKLWKPNVPAVNDSDITNFLKNETKFTNLIMEILQSASYDFVQINCKPTSDVDDFHFEYTCQYPAIFDGEVDITFTAGNKGFTKFHIV